MLPPHPPPPLFIITAELKFHFNPFQGYQYNFTKISKLFKGLYNISESENRKLTRSQGFAIKSSEYESHKGMKGMKHEET